MARARGAVFALIAVLALVGSVTIAVRTNAPPELLPSSYPVQISAPRAPRHAAGSDANEPEGAVADSLPPPVDLDACDRDLDLHGVVVRMDGAPVAGAAVAALSLPWAHGGRGPRRSAEDVPGPSSRTAVDGTFSLRLRRSEVVDLRVSGVGLPTVAVRRCQAGERVRVVLPEAVRLRLEVVDPAGAPVGGVALRIETHTSQPPAALHTVREVTSDADGTALVRGLLGGAEVFVRTVPAGPGRDIAAVLPATGEARHRVEVPRMRGLFGRVTDATTGAAIDGARIDAGGVATLRCLTDSEGTWRLPPSGAEWIGAKADGYVADSVRADADGRADFALERGFAASGRVVDSRGDAVRGALVSLVSTRFDHGQGSAESTETGEDGLFRVTALAWSCGHSLIVTAPGHGRLHRFVDPPPRGTDLDLGIVSLPAPRTIAGRVLRASGEPAAAVRVELTGPGLLQDDEPRHGRDEWRRTDDLGRYSFAELSPGTYVVAARPDGAADVRVHVELSPHRDMESVDLRLGDGRELVVRVIDEDGTPVMAGLQIGADGPPVRAWNDLRGIARFTAAPRGGTLSIGSLPFDSEFLYEPGYPLPPEGQDEMTIVLRRGAPLRCRVVDPDGQPVAGAEVEFTRPSGRFRHSSTETTDAHGWCTASVPADVPVEVAFDGLVDEKDVGLSARTTGAKAGTDVVLRCERIAMGRSLRVRVVSPGGDPVPDAVVDVSGPHRSSRATTDAEGRAVFTDLAARPAEVEAATETDWIGPVPLEVVPADQEVVLRCRRGVPLTGVVVDADGTSISACVDVWEGNAFIGSTHAPEGRFELTVPEGAGPFRVVARIDYEDPPREVEVDGARSSAEVRVVVK